VKGREIVVEAASGGFFHVGNEIGRCLVLAQSVIVLVCFFSVRKRIEAGALRVMSFAAERVTGA